MVKLKKNYSGFYRDLIAPIVLAADLVILLRKKETKEEIRPVKAIQIKASSAQSNQLSFPGTLRAFKRANLSFRVDGTVILRDIKVGQKVKEQETLIQLDPREYEIALKKTKGKVESFKAQLDFATRGL